MSESDDIARHVAGATVTHAGPFSNIEVPSLSEPLGRDFCEKWVIPFYRASLFRGADEFANALRPVYADISSELIIKLLSDFNWRPRITAAYFAAIRRDCTVQDHIGKLLLRSDVCYAGGGYCLALARFNTPTAIDYLQQYLAYYLTKPDFWFDQGDAIGALSFLDSENGTQNVESFGDEWGRFAAARDGYPMETCIERFQTQLKAVDFIEGQMGQ